MTAAGRIGRRHPSRQEVRQRVGRRRGACGTSESFPLLAKNRPCPWWRRTTESAGSSSQRINNSAAATAAGTQPRRRSGAAVVMLIAASGGGGRCLVDLPGAGCGGPAGVTYIHSNRLRQRRCRHHYFIATAHIHVRLSRGP